MSATSPSDRSSEAATDPSHQDPRGPDAGSVTVPGSRANAPIRWPRPDRSGLLLFGTCAVGLVVALVGPALVVAPNDTDASSSQIGVAFGLTVFGALIMVAAGLVQARRAKDTSPLLLAAVPAFTVLVGGIIIAASLLAASP